MALWIVATLLAGGACAEKPPPSPPPEQPPAPEPAPDEPKAQPPPPSTMHQVQEGETLWDIARAYGVSTDSIMEANRLRARDVRRLSKGAELKIAGASAPVDVLTAKERAAEQEPLPELSDGAYHRLAKGESLWTLARAYDVPIETILERNGLSADDMGALRIGQPIIIPGIKAGRIKELAPKPSRSRGIRHELGQGETIWDIAHAFQVSVAEVMAANGLSAQDVTRLRDGTRLFIPGVEADKRGRVRRKQSAREQRAAIVARRLGLGTRQAAGKLLAGQVERRWMRAAGGVDRLEGTLRWPVAKGWFVRGFGSGEGGYHLAVDIMGNIGWNVRAAARGIVGYAGNEVRGYGNMVLVIHPGGWVTMYAHNSVNFVAAGEKVPKAGILAEVGSTGISRGPHVHFELMHKGRNCDPVPLLRPGVRHRSGKLNTSKQVKWSKPLRRPDEVRCAPRRRHPRSRWVIHEDPGT